VEIHHPVTNPAVSRRIPPAARNFSVSPAEIHVIFPAMNGPLLHLACAFLLATLPAAAIPNSVLGAINDEQSPLDGTDVTDDLLDPELWAGNAALPGKWRDEGTIGTATLSHLVARPKLFGRDVILLRAIHRDDRLESLEATFVDAGSYFGYFNEKLPEGLTRRQARDEVQRRLATRQAAFQTLYQETLTALETSIARHTDDDRPREQTLGRNRTLRAEPRQWTKDGFSIRLLAAHPRLIRVTLQPADATPRDWLDRSLAETTPRHRAADLATRVQRLPDGTVQLDRLQPIAQGNTPYCGLNSLGMAARYFGLHLDEDWLAAAGGFQNTGSADGSNMLRLYNAVAAEAGFQLTRDNKLDLPGIRRAIDSGFPVIVWRRFSHDRNNLHDRFLRDFRRNPAAVLPDPNDPAERATWPNDEAPLHASVVTGYHADRKELLFLESWSGKDVPRRMRLEELAATTYLCFIFKP
jgi:hypothetical protein